MKVYFFSIQTDEPPIFDPNGPLPTPLEGGESPHYLCCSSQQPDIIVEICRQQNLTIARLEEDITLFRHWAFHQQTIDPALYSNMFRSTPLYSGDAQYGLVPIHF
jgi:hypothetical protein